MDIECDGRKTAPQVVNVAPLHGREHQGHFTPEHHGGRTRGEQLLPPWIAQQGRAARGGEYPPQYSGGGHHQGHKHHPVRESLREEEYGRGGWEDLSLRHRHARPSLSSRPQFAQERFPCQSKSKRHEHVWLGDEAEYHRRKQSPPKHRVYSEGEKEHRYPPLARHPSARQRLEYSEEEEEEWPRHGKHHHEKEGRKPRHFVESAEEEEGGKGRGVSHRHKKPKHRVESSFEYEEEERGGAKPRSHRRNKFLEEEEEQRPHRKHRRFPSEEEEEEHRHGRPRKRFDPEHLVTRDKHGNVVLEPRHEHHEHKGKKHQVTFPDGNIAIIHAADLKDPKWWREAQKKLGKSGTLIINPIIIGTGTKREEGRETRTVSAIPGLAPRHEQREGHFQEHEGERVPKGRHHEEWAQPSRAAHEQPSWNNPSATSGGANRRDTAVPTTSHFGVPVTRVLPEHQQHLQHPPTSVGELETQIRRIADQEIEQHKRHHPHVPGGDQPKGQHEAEALAKERAAEHAQKEALHKLALEKQRMQKEFEDQAKQLRALQQIEDERARIKREEEEARQRQQERVNSMAQEIAQKAQMKAERLAEQAKRVAEQKAHELIQQARQKTEQEAQRQAALETQQRIDAERHRIQEDTQRRAREEAERIKAAAEDAIKHQLRQAEEAAKKKQDEEARKAAEAAAKKAKKWKPGKYFELAKEKLKKKPEKK